MMIGAAQASGTPCFTLACCRINEMVTGVLIGELACWALSVMVEAHGMSHLTADAATERYSTNPG